MTTPTKRPEPLALNIIRKWPEGFQARLQHVWLDVVSFIPDVKLYDLQRVLAEFGLRMEVYEEAAAPPAPVQQPPLSDDRIMQFMTPWHVVGDPHDREDMIAAVRAMLAPAPVQQGELVITKNDAGHIVSVTRQNEDGVILSVLALSAPIYKAAPVQQGEAEPAEWVPSTKMWHDRIKEAHPRSDPEYWPNDFKVKYMESEILDLRRLLAAPPQAQPSNELGELIKCFDMAMDEGLSEALAETQDERLKDLIERRLMAGYWRAVGPSQAQPSAQERKAALEGVKKDAREPDFWTVCALYVGGGDTGWIPLPGYSNETEKGVKELVLQAARKEGYKGTVAGRLMELGWEIRPVYLSPSSHLTAAIDTLRAQGGENRG